MHDEHLHNPRILIVRLSHLGDVVHALPVLDAVRRAHPAARIAWAVQPEFADLLRGHPSLDELVLFDRRAGLSGWTRLERDLARFGAGWSIDAQGNTKSALVALASRATRRSGMARADWTEPFGALSLTDAAEPARPSADGAVHAVDRMFALARHVAPQLEIDARWTDEFLQPDDGSGEALFRERFASARGPFVVVHVPTPGDVRSWPLEHFAGLARDLADDHDVLLISGPAERESGLALERTLAATKRIRHWTGQSGLRALVAFQRAAARRGAVCVACDSGPMHVAWAAGMRVVLLAGPQAASRTGPWPPAAPGRSARHSVVRAQSPPHCAPCLARTCAHPSGNVCMAHIEPGAVARTVRENSGREKTVRENTGRENTARAMTARESPVRDSADRSPSVTSPVSAPVSAP